MDVNTATLRWGVDDAGSAFGIDRHPKGAEVMEALGLDLMVHHYQPARGIADNARYIREFDGWCNEHGVAWIANLEQANWVEKCVDETGRDWFDQPGGLHYFLFPEELRAELGRCERLLGLMYDEAAHTQSRRHMITELDRTMFFNPDGRRLEDAADAFTEAVRAVDARHSPYGLRIYTEHVLPVMFHCFARAGWVAATKVLKENWSPPCIACALGAALQYDTELWITPDLCRHLDHPGHSVEEYRSSLMLTYHMGADCIYTENLVFDHLVRLKHLSGVEVIFLTGLGVSRDTLRDIEACVANGATCVGLPHLLPERVIVDTGENGALKDDKGLWVATTDFLAPHVAGHVAHVLPPADELRYRLGDAQIVFRPVDGNPNRLSVTEEGVGCRVSGGEYGGQVVHGG